MQRSKAMHYTEQVKAKLFLQKFLFSFFYAMEVFCSYIPLPPLFHPNLLSDCHPRICVFALDFFHPYSLQYVPILQLTHAAKQASNKKRAYKRA